MKEAFQLCVGSIILGVGLFYAACCAVMPIVITLSCLKYIFN